MACAATASKKRRIRRARRDLGELVGRGAGRRDIVGGEHDLDVRARAAWNAIDAVLRLGEDAADGRSAAASTCSLREPQQREARLWIASPSARLAVRLLGRGELAAQAVQLGLLVEGRRRPRLRRWLEQPLAGPLDLVRARRATRRAAA